MNVNNNHNFSIIWKRMWALPILQKNTRIQLPVYTNYAYFLYLINGYCYVLDITSQIWLIFGHGECTVKTACANHTIIKTQCTTT